MTDELIKLEGNVSIAKAESLFHQMEEVLRLGHPTKICAADLSRVDTSILQLIASFMDGMNKNGVSVEWDGISDELKAAAKLLGMEQSINL